MLQPVTSSYNPEHRACIQVEAIWLNDIIVWVDSGTNFVNMLIVDFGNGTVCVWLTSSTEASAHIGCLKISSICWGDVTRVHTHPPPHLQFRGLNLQWCLWSFSGVKCLVPVYQFQVITLC